MALLLVVWTFAVLAVLAAEFARAMRDDALATRNFKQETIAHYVCIAGINEALLAVQAFRVEDLDDIELEDQRDGPGDPVRVLNLGDGQWVDAEFDRTPYQVRIFDEGGKIPLNSVSGEALLVIFENLEIEPDTAEILVDSILDWSDEDDSHRVNGAEDDYYEGLPRPYGAKDAAFDAVEELLLVRGVTEDLFYGDDTYPGLGEIFTVFHKRRGPVNTRSATPEVMIALSGIGRDEALEFQRSRNNDPGNDPQILNDLLGQSGVSARQFKMTDMTIEVRVLDERERVLSQVGAVVHMGSSGDGFRFLRWYDAVFSSDEEPGAEGEHDEHGTDDEAGVAEG